MRGSGTTAPLWRRMAPDQRERVFNLVEYMAVRGLHGVVIAHYCGISVSQLYLALSKLQIRLRNYRDGKGPEGSKVVKVATASIRTSRKGTG